MIALPTLLLALTALSRIRYGGWWIPMALAASALGDLAGATRFFVGQVLCFALAQGFLAIDLGRCCTPKVKKRIPLAALCIALSVLSWTSMLPIERLVLVPYATLLLSVVGYAGLQRRSCSCWYLLAALLFLGSDLCIFITRYWGPLPYSRWLILTPYYLAQLLYWVLFMRRKASNG